MADLQQRADDLTAALQTYDAILVLAVESRKLQEILDAHRRKLNRQDLNSFMEIAKVMRKNAGL